MHFVNTKKSNKVSIYFDKFFICVCLGAAVQSMGHLTLRRRRHRTFKLAETGGGRDGSSGATITWRLERVIYTGQTGGAGTIRPADQFRLDQSTSDSRVAFNFAKSFGFFGTTTIQPL